MSKAEKVQTRTWLVTGKNDHRITVEWEEHGWNPPSSVVSVDGEVISTSTFWIRHFCFGAHALHLEDFPNRQIILKYNEKAGYSLVVDGQKILPEVENQYLSISV